MANSNETVFTVEDLKKMHDFGGLTAYIEMAEFIARRSKEYEQLLGVHMDTPDLGREANDPGFMGMSRNGKGNMVDAYRVDVKVADDKWERRVVPFRFVFFKEEFEAEFNAAKPDTAEFDILLVKNK